MNLIITNLTSGHAGMVQKFANFVEGVLGRELLELMKQSSFDQRSEAIQF